MAKEYSEKLKDPRWQKKRLEIFERDSWSCQRCYDGDSTLVVHHLRYLSGKDPWDYPNEYLITLCEECHEYETSQRPGIESDLLAMIRPLFLSDDIYDITSGFHQMNLHHSHEVVASSLGWALSSPEIQKTLIDLYFEHIHSEAMKKRESVKAE